jgi:hypothetical protein
MHSRTLQSLLDCRDRWVLENCPPQMTTLNTISPRAAFMTLGVWDLGMIGQNFLPWAEFTAPSGR